jgi:GST-like protein
LEEFPHVKRWHEEIAARPAVKRGVEVLTALRKPMIDDKAKENLFGKAQYQKR